jgi:hypothetical protein
VSDAAAGWRLLVTVTGTREEVERARQVLQNTKQIDLEPFDMRETA